MEQKHYLVLLALVVIIAVIPLMMYNGLGEEQGYFGGSDDAAGSMIAETGYQPWFTSIWEPPSAEIASLLFAVQAAIGAIIIGYILGYFHGQSSERKKLKKELESQSENTSE
jgi:cobalt/nickel transport protein